MELVSSRDEFQPNYFLFYKTICAFAPNSNDFKKFLGTSLYNGVYNFPRQNIMLTIFYGICGTRLWKRQVLRKVISLISFKTVFFCKIVLKIKLLSKIPLDSDDK